MKKNKLQALFLNEIKGKSLSAKQARMGYLFVLPIIIGIVGIFIPLIVQSFRFSISEIEIGSDGFTLIDKGFEFYKKAIFEDPDLLKKLILSVKNMFVDLVTIILFSIFIATLLNRNFKGRTLARLLFFLPVISMTGIVGAIDASNLAPISSSGAQTGAMGGFALVDINTILSNVKIGTEIISFVSGAIDQVYTIVTQSGIQILIMLTAMQGIPISVKEAATTEGCGEWEYFWKILFPMISPYILVGAVYTIISSFTSPGNALMADIMAMNKTVNLFSYSSAVSIMYFIIVSIILLLIVLILRKFVKYSD